MEKKGDTSPITGDRLVSKTTNENYRDGYDRIFPKDRCKECEGTGYVDYPIMWGGGVVDYTCVECNGTGKKK